MYTQYIVKYTEHHSVRSNYHYYQPLAYLIDRHFAFVLIFSTRAQVILLLYTSSRNVYQLSVILNTIRSNICSAFFLYKAHKFISTIIKMLLVDPKMDFFAALYLCNDCNVLSIDLSWS